MSFASAPALRRVAQLVGTGAAAALVVTGLSAGTALAAPVESGAIDCIVPMADNAVGSSIATVEKDPHTFTAAQVAEFERQFLKDMDAKGIDIDLEDIREPYVIETYIHLLHEDGTVEGGNVPRTWIREQMKYLNKSYRGHGHSAPGVRTPFKFELAGVTRTLDTQNWSEGLQPGSADDLAMKTELRQPGSTAETLNMYFADMSGSGLLGYATFPSDYDNQPVRDGVVNEVQSMPGGSAAPFNLGGTASHEVGHWVGLYHTFQGGCADGDEVEDTPPQASPTSGCPEGRDSCTGGGIDPIHNYMDYSADACYDQFTLGQRERALDQYATYRDGVE